MKYQDSTPGDAGQRLHGRRHPQTPKQSPRKLAGGTGANTERTDCTPVEPLLIARKRAAAMLGVGERKAWELGNRRVIRTVKIGSRTLYSVESIRAWVAAGCPDREGGTQ